MANYSNAYVRSSAGEDEDPSSFAEFDLNKFLAVIRKNLIYMAMFYALSLSAVYLYVYYRVQLYQASSVLKIEVKGSASMFGLGIFRSQDEMSSYLMGEIEIIKSNMTYQEVISKLELHTQCYSLGRVNDFEMFNNSPFKPTISIKDGSFFGKKMYVEFINATQYKLSFQSHQEEITQTYSVGKTIETPYFSLKIDKTSNFSEASFEQKYYFIAYNDNQTQADLANNLGVGILNVGAMTLQVSYTSPNPYKAQAVVNAVNDAYLKQAVENKNRGYKQTRIYLQAQLDTALKNVEYWEKRIEEYKREKFGFNAATTNVNVSEILDRIRAAQEQRFKLRNELQLYKKVEESVFTDTSTLIIDAFAKQVSDQRIAAQLSQIYAANKKFASLAESYTDQTYAYKARLKDLEQKQSEFLRLLAFNKENLIIEKERLDSAIRRYEASIPQGEVVDLELRKMQRYAERYASYIGGILNNIIETEMAEAGTVPNFQILSAANLPETPISTSSQSLYFAAAGFATALSVLLILVRYFMLNQIVSLKELEKMTSVPILGIVPHYTKHKMANSQLIVHRNPKSGISESMRSIRTNLDFMSHEGKKRIISVTSTISGEGKTFVAVNLAGIIALSDTKVIVLDLDLRKPKLNLAFGVENTIGMSTLLIGKNKLEDCIHQSEINNLHFITSGPQPPNPAELLLSEEFNKLIQNLQEQYDVVVFDTPPVGLVTDGLIAMRKADIPIYVVRADYSERNFVFDLNKMVSKNNFTKLSVVLNGVGKPGSYGYSYGYGKGYGYGYGYGYGSGYGYQSGYYEDTEKHSFRERLKKIYEDLKNFKFKRK